MKGMKQLGIQHIYTWKCNNEARYLKQKCLLSEVEGKTGHVQGSIPVGGRMI
jgi:hypothetical protein